MKSAEYEIRGQLEHSIVNRSKGTLCGSCTIVVSGHCVRMGWRNPLPHGAWRFRVVQGPPDGLPTLHCVTQVSLTRPWYDIDQLCPESLLASGVVLMYGTTLQS